MPDPLPGKLFRILHLEDDPDDVRLTRRALQADGIEANVESVETREAFSAALDHGGIDVILSDFALPMFDGLSALDIARAKAPDVPFILVSGTIGEEMAIECVRRGVTDYVLKHHVSRLPAAVRRAQVEVEERRQRRQAEEVLQREQQFLAAMLDSLEAGIVACDAEGRLTTFNRATRELHGLPQEQLPPERWAEHYRLFHPDGTTLMEKEEIPLYRALGGERVRNVEMVVAPNGGTPRTLLASGRQILDAQGEKLGAVVALHDITERKKLEGQLRQAQKMEAVGSLAGGVAHDFNNLLSVILGYGEIVLRDRQLSPHLRSKIEQIQGAAERAASLTRQLLAFSRKQILEPKVLDLNGMLADVEKMLRRLIGEDVEVVTLKARPLARIKADPGQIEQILMNLAVNARDAMPRGGDLRIATANVVLTEVEAARNPGMRPGPHVVLEVSDTGTGMTPEVLARIFEPFFTTKEKGEGTGLGLSTVYGIVKQAGGYIQVESSPGAGSTFKCFFPQVDEPLDTLNHSLESECPTGTETILVVEDDESVRNLTCEVLNSCGYKVLSAVCAEEAREKSQSHPGPIHILITDVILPGAGGQQIAKQLAGARPEMEVLYISGYPDGSITHQGALEAGVDYLQKPFTPTVLGCKVRSILDRVPARSR